MPLGANSVSIDVTEIPFAARGPEEARALDVASVHASSASFVWRSLHRMGVRDADLDDELQEVFVVVHRRLAQWDRRSKLTSWLFGICLRVASDYRRRAWVRRERPTEALPEMPSDLADAPDVLLEQRQARVLLDLALDSIDVERRAVFVMYEIDEMSCHEIAECIGVPVGTVHSRLFTARKELEVAVRRIQTMTRTRSRR